MTLSCEALNIFVIAVAYFIGLKERARIRKTNSESVSISEVGIIDAVIESAVTENITPKSHVKCPKFILFNLFLSSLIMIAIVLEWLSTAIVFIVGTEIALLINYPTLHHQRERMTAHAPNA